MNKVSSHTLLLSMFINAMIWKDRVEVCETVSGRTPLSSSQGRPTWMWEVSRSAGSAKGPDSRRVSQTSTRSLFQRRKLE